MTQMVVSVPEAHSGLVDSSITLKTVSILGVGHLGSNIGYVLSKLGVAEFNLYDFDTVERRNIAGCPFFKKHVGISKVNVMQSILENSSIEPKLVNTHNKKIESKTKISPTHYYILAADSIESRINI